MNNNIKHDTKWHQHTRKLGTQKASYRPEIFPTLLCSLCQICISFPKFSCFPFVSLLSALGLVSFFVRSAVLPGVSGLPSSLIAVRVPGFWIPCFWPAFVLCFVESSVHFLSPVSSICVQILPATRPSVTASRCVSGELDVPDYCFFPPKIHHKSSVIKLCSEQLNCSKRSLNKSDDAAEEFFKTGKLCFKMTTTALFHHSGKKPVMTSLS